jgi:uncharacterized protein YdhG (YjbR/CyaY superfamily)
MKRAFTPNTFTVSMPSDNTVSDKASTIDAFLSGLSDEKRAALEKLRRTIRAAVPGAEECIAYGVPAFRLEGKFLVGFGAGAGHCSFYPGGTAMTPYRRELAGYDTSRGTIRFQPGTGLPASLVRRIVKSRVRALGLRPGRGKKEGAASHGHSRRKAGKPENAR